MQRKKPIDIDFGLGVSYNVCNDYPAGGKINEAYIFTD